MLKRLLFKLTIPLNENSKFRIETEIDVLPGVKNVSLDQKTGKCQVIFEENKISQKDIIRVVHKLSYEGSLSEIREIPNIQESAYFVKGMHCASCEVLIEKRLLKESGIKAVESSAGNGELVVEHEGPAPSINKLNTIFASSGYVFSKEPEHKPTGQKPVSVKGNMQLLINKRKLNNFLVIFGVSLVFIVGFTLLHKSGLSALVSVNAKSVLPMFIVFGLLAGFSSCAALVGGIILSMSKQWLDNYADNDSTIRKLQPHILFNLGRLVSYVLLGAVLGAIGNIFQLSFTFTSILVIAISIMMFFLALQMLGVRYFQKFQITMPKSVTRHIADETNFKGRYMPLLMGAATFFLPCGFTITAQSLALTTGSALQGSLIMFFFALGTLPALLIIGLSSVTFTKKPHLANRFLKTAGIIVMFFAIFNINAQLNVLGLRSLDDIDFKSSQAAIASEDGFPEIVNGQQLLKMEASSYSYQPDRLKIRAGIPVRWEITDIGTSGCTNAVMAKGLFDGQIPLTPGQTSIKEFTPKEPGRYKFSCWMGMISGVIDVVDVGKNGVTIPLTDEEVVPSGAQGCGCGGSGGTGTCGG